jgi:hypothetical protein
MIFDFSSEEDRVKEIKDTVKFKMTSGIWNMYHFNASSKVGCVSEIAQDYADEIIKTGKEANLRDFETFYFSKVPSTQFVENALAFEKKLEEGDMFITFNEAFFYAWIRVIFDSFYGIVQRELNIINTFKVHGHTVKHTSPTVDKMFAIDMTYELPNGKLCGVQVKPMSYYFGCKKGKADIINDHKINLQKNQKWLENPEHEKVEYVFYQGDDLHIKDFEEVVSLGCTS